MKGVACEEVLKGAWPSLGKAGFPFLQKGGNVSAGEKRDTWGEANEGSEGRDEAKVPRGRLGSEDWGVG